MYRRSNKKQTPLLTREDVYAKMESFQYYRETENLVLEMLEEEFASKMLVRPTWGNYFYKVFNEEFRRIYRGDMPRIYRIYERTYSKIEHRHFADSFDLFLLGYLAKELVFFFNEGSPLDGGGLIY